MLNSIRLCSLVAWLAIASAELAHAATSPCAAAGFRQFDFWLGTWEVTQADGKRAGRNVISSEDQGCQLLERWTSASGGTGTSMNFYDPKTDIWTQQWVGMGILLRMTGGLKNGAMVLEGPLQYLDSGKTTVLRGIWTPLPDGRVRQQFLESTDGKTWTDWFDGYYRRGSGD